MKTLQWCHNKCDAVSNYRRLDCLLNRLFRRRSKKTSNGQKRGKCFHLITSRISLNGCGCCSYVWRKIEKMSEVKKNINATLLICHKLHMGRIIGIWVFHYHQYILYIMYIYIYLKEFEVHKLRFNVSKRTTLFLFLTMSKSSLSPVWNAYYVHLKRTNLHLCNLHILFNTNGNCLFDFDIESRNFLSSLIMYGSGIKIS